MGVSKREEQNGTSFSIFCWSKVDVDGIESSHLVWWPLSQTHALSVAEPALRVPPEEVQEQQRLAEAVGRLHQLLPFLLQDPPGTVVFPVGQAWRYHGQMANTRMHSISWLQRMSFTGTSVYFVHLLRTEKLSCLSIAN